MSMLRGRKGPSFIHSPRSNGFLRLSLDALERLHPAVLGLRLLLLLLLHSWRCAANAARGKPAADAAAAAAGEPELLSAAVHLGGEHLLLKEMKDARGTLIPWGANGQRDGDVSTEMGAGDISGEHFSNSRSAVLL